MAQQRTYKLKKSPPDSRDKMHAPLPKLVQLPTSVDLRPAMPPVLDQGQLGSCTSNATSNALRYLLKKEKRIVFQPSRLYIYWNTRVNIEGVAGSEDSGCCIRDVCKAVQKYHACQEVVWPYVESQFSVAPSLLAYKNANLYRNVSYASVSQDLVIMQKTLASGYPIVVGIQVYDSFETDAVAATGQVPMPAIATESCLGGHCVLIVGYDTVKACFIGMNAWGTGWGAAGYFYIPFAYMLNPDLASDFWVFTLF